MKSCQRTDAVACMVVLAVRLESHFEAEKMSKNSGYAKVSDFDVPEEILSVLPTDPYEQLDLARKITSIAVASRVSKLEAEAGKLRQKVTENEQMIYGLQAKLSQSQQNLQEANARLSQALDEQAKLANEKNVLAATVKKLNRDVAKLETFRKTLMQSLQDDDEASQSDITEKGTDQQSASVRASLSLSLRDNDNDALPKSSLVTSGSLETDSSVQDISRSEVDASVGHGSSQGLSLTTHFSPQHSPGGSPEGSSPKEMPAAVSPRWHSDSRSPTRGEFEARASLSSSLPGSHHATAPNSPPHIGLLPARTQRIDGKEFFRQARSRLSYEQFSAFLANIKELNSHRQSKEETLRRADEIFGPDNKDLYLAFDGLLSRHLPYQG